MPNACLAKSMVWYTYEEVSRAHIHIPTYYSRNDEIEWEVSHSTEFVSENEEED